MGLQIFLSSLQILWPLKASHPGLIIGYNPWVLFMHMTPFLPIPSRRDFVSKFLLLLYHVRFIEKSEEIYWSFFPPQRIGWYSCGGRLSNFWKVACHPHADLKSPGR